MGTYSLDFMAATVGAYITDGDLRWKEFCYALLEYKDEVGSGKAEPLFQVIWYYVAFMRHLCPTYALSNLPCFILHAFGELWDPCTQNKYWISLSQVPTLGLPAWCGRIAHTWRFWHLSYHSSIIIQMLGCGKELLAISVQARRRFMLWNTTINTLPSINNLQPEDRPNPAYPYQTEYTSLKDSSKHRFKYICKLHEDKLIFRAIRMRGNDICIKFVHQYSRDVHLKCSALGFAPTLHGFESLPGGWYMVVMDFVDGTYELLEDSPFKLSFSTEVGEKLASLHQAGYVHGDIRATNIMVKKNGEQGIMLLDCDWAGVIGEIRYPMNVNVTDVRRPEGAIDKQLILAEHDMAMISYMSNDSVHPVAFIWYYRSILCLFVHCQ